MDMQGSDHLTVLDYLGKKVMIADMRELPTRHVFTSDDFRRWMDDVAMKIFGLQSDAFLSAYHEGKFEGVAMASYIASVEPLLNQ